jgi:hypothetical protein
MLVILKHQGFCANGKRLFLKHKRKQKEQKRQRCSPPARTCYAKSMQISLSLDSLFLLLKQGPKTRQISKASPLNQISYVVHREQALLSKTHIILELSLGTLFFKYSLMALLPGPKPPSLLLKCSFGFHFLRRTILRPFFGQKQLQVAT